MNNYGVATARYETFAGNKEPQKITNFITELGGKCVIKFDGLAAGKGVFVCESFSEAQQALTEISARYGSEAAIVIEEKLEGTELSIIGITDGREIKLFQPSQDHKRLQENDRGPNTGGMGAYTPVASVTPQLIARINERIIQPTLRGISAQAFNYQGFIYFGIMISNEMPYLLEYNVRLGDPETQVLLPSLKTDLVEILLAVRDDRLRDMELTFFDEYFIDVVLVSEGYPGAYEKGLPISGLEAVPNDVQVFHAGTKRIGNDIVTDGGRVLNIVASDTGFVSARRKVYQAIERITFHGMQYRGDIGFRNQ
jgi:phosphoribosylamine--glycine ligase